MSEKERKGPGEPPGARGERGSPVEGEPEPGEGPSTTVIATDVEAALRGFGFPGNARELIEQARANGADEPVIDKLAELPDRSFSSLGDALRALDLLS